MRLYILIFFLLSGLVHSVLVSPNIYTNRFKRNASSLRSVKRGDVKEGELLRQGKITSSNVQKKNIKSQDHWKLDDLAVEVLKNADRRNKKNGSNAKRNIKRRLSKYQLEHDGTQPLDKLISKRNRSLDFEFLSQVKSGFSVPDTNINLIDNQKDDKDELSSQAKKSKTNQNSNHINGSNMKNTKKHAILHFSDLPVSQPVSTYDNQKRRYKKVKIVQRMPQLSTNESKLDTTTVVVENKSDVKSISIKRGTYLFQDIGIKDNNISSLVIRKHSKAVEERSDLSDLHFPLNQNITHNKILRYGNKSLFSTLFSGKDKDTLTTRLPLQQITTPYVPIPLIASRRNEKLTQEKPTLTDFEKEQPNDKVYHSNYHETVNRSAKRVPIRKGHHSGGFVSLMSKSYNNRNLLPKSSHNRFKAINENLHRSLNSKAHGHHSNDNLQKLHNSRYSLPKRRENVLKEIKENLQPRLKAKENSHNSDDNLQQLYKRYYPLQKSRQNILKRVNENINARLNSNSQGQQAIPHFHSQNNQINEGFTDSSFSDEISDDYFDDEFDISESWSEEFDDFDGFDQTSEENYLEDGKIQGLLFLSPLQKAKSNAQKEGLLNQNKNRGIATNSVLTDKRAHQRQNQILSQQTPRSVIGQLGLLNPRFRYDTFGQIQKRTLGDMNIFSESEYESASYEFDDDSEYEFDASDTDDQKRIHAYNGINNIYQGPLRLRSETSQQGTIHGRHVLNEQNAHNSILRQFPTHYLSQRPIPASGKTEYIPPVVERGIANGQSYPYQPRHVSPRVNFLYTKRLKQQNDRTNHLIYLDMLSRIKARNQNRLLQRNVLFEGIQQRQSSFQKENDFDDFEYIDSDDEYNSDEYYDENDDYSDEYYDETSEKGDSKNFKDEDDQFHTASNKTDTSFHNNGTIRKQDFVEHMVDKEWIKD